MKVPTDYAEQATQCADGVPRQVIANLLERLLPRVPVARRPALPDVPAPAPAPAPAPSPFGGVGRKVRRRKPRRGANRSYEVVIATGAYNHRRGTWRHAMVTAILACTDEASALAYMAEHYPQFASKGVDLNWVATEAGYVRII